MNPLIEDVRTLWRREPVAVVAAVTSVIVFAAAKAGVILPEASVLQAVAAVLPILFGGAAARANVTPSK